MNKSVIFVNALCKCNEIKLLKKEQLIRLESAADYGEALKMLYDYGYSRTDSKDIDKLIETQINGLISFITENSPSPYLSAVLLNPFLYNNAKLYYKSHFAAVPDSFYEISDTEIKNGILERDYSKLPLALKKKLVELDKSDSSDGKIGEKPLDGKVIDSAFNVAMYEDNLSAAKKSGDKSLKRYAKTEIDLNNFVGFIRCRGLKRPWEYCKEMLYGGGLIPLSVFERLFGESDKEIKNSFLTGPYADVIHDILDGKINIDMSIDSVLADFSILETMDMNSFSPFLYYVKRQLIEYRVVRMILTLIKNNARGEINKRMRGLYD